jgi:hypothetical protein
MEVRVQLKVCEGCGCLWYRAQNRGNVYCRDCQTRLEEFPSPQSRKRRGRPSRKVLINPPLVKIWAVADVPGGAQ